MHEVEVGTPVFLPHSIELFDHRIIFSQRTDNEIWLGPEQRVVAHGLRNLMGAYCKDTQVEDDEED